MRLCRRVRRDHWKGMSVAQRAAIVAQQAQQAAERKASLQVRLHPLFDPARNSQTCDRQLLCRHTDNHGRQPGRGH